MDLVTRLNLFAESAGLTFREKAAVIERMKMVEERTGLVICPCTFIPAGSTAVDLIDYTRCPCPEVLRHVASFGSCGCGLFTVA